MLARKYRLNEDQDIECVKRDGKTLKSVSFVIKYLKRSDKEPARTAFIISKSVSGNSSLRNRAKRAMSEAVRQTLYSLKNGYDIVFIAYPPIIKQYTSDLMAEVNGALLKAGLIK